MNIEHDLREYLEKEPNLSRNDRPSYLKTIFHKHLEINKLEHLVTGDEVGNIIGEAKSQYVKMRFPIRISKRLMDGEGQKQIALMEGLLGYLHRNKLLRKIVKFDYRD